MTVIRDFFTRRPGWVRVAPFLFFVILTIGQGALGETSPYWVYAVKTLVGAVILWIIWPLIPEMRWRISWEAVGVGVLIFIVWVGLDPYYPHLSAADRRWNPYAQFGHDSGWALLFIVARLLGSTFVVPPLEEVFFRSFLYRYFARQDFLSIGLEFHGWRPFLATSVIFGLAHSEWLAGILCGLAYQWLVIRNQRLGEAMTAHAITNCLLGLWVVFRGAWQFW